MNSKGGESTFQSALPVLLLRSLHGICLNILPLSGHHRSPVSLRQEGNKSKPRIPVAKRGRPLVAPTNSWSVELRTSGTRAQPIPAEQIKETKTYPVGATMGRPSNPGKRTANGKLKIPVAQRGRPLVAPTNSCSAERKNVEPHITETLKNKNG